MKPNIVVETLDQKPVTQHSSEFVERKGLGHPDYMIDSACEAVSVALSKHYLKHFGMVLHHNVDKGLLVGGRASPKFGGGTLDEPIYILVAGRATIEVDGPEGKATVPYGSLAISAVRKFIKKNFRFLDPDTHVIVDYKIRPGSVDLREVFKQGEETPLSNDTSFGVGYAPLTKLEELTLRTERMINSKEFKKRLPESGEDCKVMALRKNKEITLTMADGIISHLAPDLDHYLSVKEEIKSSVLDLASKILSDEEIQVQVNTGDVVRKPAEKSVVYLTVTGTSAEAGDDGNTGRGNRANGLITPSRQMSLEATAGKNAISHAGKIYNIEAKLLADRIYREVSGLEEVYVKLLAQIGRRIDDPLVASVQYIPEDGTDHKASKYEIEGIVEDELGKIGRVTQMVIDGKVQLF